ncbi:hypothetical protein [Halomonas sp.]|uniref:hypothetical protein n=1 Tax=Halomonas sp. TaxID=1486246 RepID=UPI00257BD7FD|nr:hypothetical protein [Halomonas sp.]MCJ8287870.1 hypothetical protein [Halomonas sp.]NQY72590.1 hypothetical protein [Halomonas sp.]
MALYKFSPSLYMWGRAAAPEVRSGLALLKGGLASFVTPCGVAAALVKSAGVTHPHASDLAV